jgi:hypothetical protein
MVAAEAMRPDARVVLAASPQLSDISHGAPHRMRYGPLVDDVRLTVLDASIRSYWSIWI